MANLKEIRSRINSVSSTKQITNAMKMVSAAKLSKAQEAITAMRPYANKLTELLQNLSSSSQGGDSLYAQDREVNNVLIVAISSNRGLAGAFNTNIIKQVKQIVEEHYADKNVKLMTLGKKADDILKKSYTVSQHHSEIVEKTNFEGVSELAEDMMSSFVNEEFDKIVFVYNRFINAATQKVATEQFLPIEPKETENQEEDSNEVDYIFEPEKDKIIKELIPKSLKIQLFKAIRDSVASEHGARMTAMHKATDNATELLEDLTLSYNKARQAAITNEILEIVGGAEALNN